jgi:hypothetical protein
MWRPKNDSRRKDFNDDEQDEKKSTPKPKRDFKGQRVKRFYHMKNGQRCHAWDIFLDKFELWKQGEVPCKAEWVVLKGGHQPEPYGRVYCSSCGATSFNLSEMETETIIL